MVGLIKRPFIDKYTGVFYEPGKEVEFADKRLNELVALGYVEARGEVKPEPKTETKKVETKKAPVKKATTKKK